ncbi:hypothetical protein [Paenibacillus sinensis]|uniref:hypothetical protein n=1 Tax=Paenibacillus sinensis TaxID=2834413 RepID=UPI001CA911A5|nr:hypothetical protein [Paenibacillus sinensis]
MIRGTNSSIEFTTRAHYSSTSSGTKYFILKPFKNNDGGFPKEIKNSQFVDDLEIRIDLVQFIITQTLGGTRSTDISCMSKQPVSGNPSAAGFLL